MALYIRILGPLEVSAGDGPLPLTRAKPRALLALLLVHAGEVVSTDRLVDELWSGRAPATARDALQNYVSQLRKTLGRDVLITRPPGYVLEIEPEQTDAGHFERLVAEARTANGPEETAAALREALGLWRGSAFADFAYDSFAELEAARLEELRAAAREDLVDAELELGRHSELVPELEELVAEQPYRERIRAQLMLALYRSGRQADALEAFQAARQTLADELGLEPSPALRALEHSILVQDPELAPAAADAAATPSLEQRRKTVTVLSAELTPAEALDPERHHSATVQALGIARNAIEAHEGWIQAQAGDEILGVFGQPASHEDDALRAVRAAAEIRRAAALRSDLPLELRIGVDTGPVLAGHGFVSGDVVSTAKRLHVIAEPGDVLLGKETVALTRHAITSETVGSADRLLEVEADVPAVARYLEAPLVGREEDLAALLRAFEDAAGADRLRLLTLVGEPGIGKTRLASELAARVQGTATILVGRCVPYGEGAAYAPLREMVSSVDLDGALGGDADAELVRQRVRELVGLAEGTAPAAEGAWAVRRLFEALARERPLVLLFEDVHWAEPSLRDLVEQLHGRASGPALALCIRRPEVRDRPAWPGDELALAPLGGDDCAALVAALPGSDALPADARARIADTAEGNPLFAEQLLAYAQEGGAGALDAVPPSVEALIASRLDLLHADERGVLQRAAVIGREFSHHAVAELSPDSTPSLSGQLPDLVRKGLVHPIATVDGKETHRFHHALVRDVAYDGLPKAERAELHEAFGDWLSEQPDAPDEVVGFHLEQAYRYRTELAPPDRHAKQLALDAGTHLGAAGMREWRRSDVPATVNLLERATTLLPDGDRRSELLCELGIAFIGAGDKGRAETALQSAAGAEQAGLRRWAQLELARLRLEGTAQATTTEFLVLAEAATPALEAVDNHRALGRAWLLVGFVEGGIRGNHTAWLEAATRALGHYRRAGWSVATCVQQIAAAIYYGPIPVEQGIRRCHTLLGDEPSGIGQANIVLFLGGLHAMHGDFDEARRLVGEAEGIYNELGHARSVATLCWPVKADIELLAGDAVAAEDVLRATCETLRRLHDDNAYSTRAAELAEAAYHSGRYEDAARWAAEAEAYAGGDDLIVQPLWRSIRSKLLARQGSLLEAEALAREALALVDQTECLNRRAKVRLDLAAVLRLAGRATEATAETDDAIDLYLQKGNIVAAEQARGFLTEPALT